MGHETNHDEQKERERDKLDKLGVVFPQFIVNLSIPFHRQAYHGRHSKENVTSELKSE
ncbi:uncharacterized protein MELLADRAFT_88900 [Melampsora larici-populina 98AG31]|uniref:Uncharacterized protein n=1 Tax=Melampsora larici-populina (strain 98AG31 / pathotype 3-4-7) TaxID=747676 RepID=F4R674_MELLP|nr:uncharacterized protein MELLADRAFT_88900 [Melampsora larici-populina 98AG31]EGG12516.1 hypothetical protein MELLADRAFT_88900 [Melampsora larici-populina 98AG31]